MHDLPQEATRAVPSLWARQLPLGTLYDSDPSMALRFRTRPPTTMFEIRESDDASANYAAMADILLAVAPNHPVSGRDLANEDLSFGESHPHYRWLQWSGDTPVGVFTAAEETAEPSPGLFRVHAAVAPCWQGRSAGRELWIHCLAALLTRHAVAELACETKADQARGIRFLQDRGFILGQTIQQSELDIAGYDPAEQPDRRHSLSAQGIQFLSLAKVSAADPDWFAKYHELRMEFLADLVYPPASRTLAEHWAEHQRHRAFDPSMTFIAVRNGEWLALTALWRSAADPTLWWTSLTGVGRAHRRLGLASALKTTAIEAVQRRGGTRIRTDTVAGTPMFKINQAFGFRPLPDAQTWRRSMCGATDVQEVLR